MFTKCTLTGHVKQSAQPKDCSESTFHAPCSSTIMRLTCPSTNWPQKASSFPKVNIAMSVLLLIVFFTLRQGLHPNHRWRLHFLKKCVWGKSISKLLVGEKLHTSHSLCEPWTLNREPWTSNLGLTLAVQAPQLCLLGRQKSLTVAHPAGFLEEGNDGLSQAHLLILLGLLHEGLHQPTQWSDSIRWWDQKCWPYVNAEICTRT